MAEIASRLRALRTLREGARGDGKPAPVKRLSKRFLEQQQAKKGKRRP